jgi:hypothetical protein
MTGRHQQKSRPKGRAIKVGIFYREIRQIREKKGVSGAFLQLLPKSLMGILLYEVSGYENFAYLVFRGLIKTLFVIFLPSLVALDRKVGFIDNSAYAERSERDIVLILEIVSRASGTTLAAIAGLTFRRLTELLGIYFSSEVIDESRRLRVFRSSPRTFRCCGSRPFLRHCAW